MTEDLDTTQLLGDLSSALRQAAEGAPVPVAWPLLSAALLVDQTGRALITVDYDLSDELRETAALADMLRLAFGHPWQDQHQPDRVQAALAQARRAVTVCTELTTAARERCEQAVPV